LKVDCVYVAASELDARFTRTCIASVRYFYPDIPIRLLAGSRLPGGLLRELQNHWSVTLAEIPSGNYGWGWVKLEPLFGTPGEKFLMLDSDTVLVGPVLDECADSDAAFVVDNEPYSADRIRQYYYDWRLVRSQDPEARPPRFVFNSGQWLGTAGIIQRADFAPWVEWSSPRRLKHTGCFFPGDQGVMNYVLNQKALLQNVRVDTRALMHWAGRSLVGFEPQSVASGTAAPRIIHWAGVKKFARHSMAGADLLSFFEDYYYKRIQYGYPRRAVAVIQNGLLQCRASVAVRIRLRIRKWTTRATPRVPRLSEAAPTASLSESDR
jgi:hypothetical protein